MEMKGRHLGDAQGRAQGLFQLRKARLSQGFKSNDTDTHGKIHGADVDLRNE